MGVAGLAALDAGGVAAFAAGAPDGASEGFVSRASGESFMGWVSSGTTPGE